MERVGFITSSKENEKRRAILPKDLEKVKNCNYLFFEKDYGKILGIDDKEYEKKGCHILSRNEILNCDIICDPKIGDADYLNEIKKGATIWGWIHAVQNRNITDKIINNRLTAYAWEDMYEENRHVFWKNNELAGIAAILDAYRIKGTLPNNNKVAIIGNGNTARGTMKILSQLGAEIEVFGRKDETLLRKNLSRFDTIVNCVLWDVNRKDHIINENDLLKMKKNSMIIDVSCDRNGAIETSIPTTIDNPVYYKKGILHYVVDHTPSIFYEIASYAISEEVVKYLDFLITGQKNQVLENSLIIKHGKILDERIIEFQNRKENN